MSKDWARLGSVVRQRRAELGLTRDEVNLRGGPSDTTQEKVEKGLGAVYGQTLAKLDAGLGWTSGSAARVVDGEDPIAAPEAPDDEIVHTRFHQAATRVRRRPYADRTYMDLWSEWMDHTLAVLRLEVEYGRRRGLKLSAAQQELAGILDSVQRTGPDETWQPPWDAEEDYQHMYGLASPEAQAAGQAYTDPRGRWVSVEDYSKPYLHEAGAAAYDGDPEPSDDDDEVHPS